MISKVCVIDAGHPLFGQWLEVSATGLGRRVGWIKVVLPDGRHRWVPEKATDLDDSACDVPRNHDLPLVSVRTLLPLAEYVRTRLPYAGERGDGTPGYSAELATGAGPTGSAGDFSAEIVADDDTDNTATSGETAGAAALVHAVHSRFPHAGQGGSK